MTIVCDYAKPYIPEYSICQKSAYYTCPHAISFADIILCRQTDRSESESCERLDQ